MALTYSLAPKIGNEAASFSLRGTDNKIYTLETFKDAKALAVIFMCNHCPYVVAVQERINALAKKYKAQGLALVGINSNDPIKYPADNFEAMQARALEQGFVFPYLYDETQKVARDYAAVCTPDPYLFSNQNQKFLLQYHGRIDDNWKEPKSVNSNDLADAIEAVLAGKTPRTEQKPAMGCSIKWKQ